MQNALSYESLKINLEKLKMTTAFAALDNILEAGRVEEYSTVEIIDKLLDTELKARHQRRVSWATPYSSTSGCWPMGQQPEVMGWGGGAT